ncbi:protein hypothetical protein [Limosa lapponica baueri]|uniref:Uncharacterized protein n=1 Tax=Limosa lapponica baueri TaxID=1758121 RepID=A0A2I0T5N8_LIMLA|nr:protein hypothetical protein [Limosa lapponica baueri]
MSGGHSGYELCEAKAILSELKSIRKAISSGEREKQDLMKSLAKLREKFNLEQTIGMSEPDLSSSSVNSQLCFSRQTLDTGSQTDISGEIWLVFLVDLLSKDFLKRAGPVVFISMQSFACLMKQLERVAVSVAESCL